MTPNDQTIAAYEAGSQDWLAAHPTGKRYPEVDQWLAAAVAGLTPDAKILEVGSNTGLDALHLRRLGYDPQCSDATPAFVANLHSRGFPATQLNAITDELGGPWDVIVANAVLQHIPQFLLVAMKIQRALAPGGTLALSLPEGPDDWAWDSRLSQTRFWRTWTEGAARATLAAAGLADVKVSRYTARDGAAWMLMLAK